MTFLDATPQVAAEMGDTSVNIHHLIPTDMLKPLLVEVERFFTGAGEVQNSSPPVTIIELHLQALTLLTVGLSTYTPALLTTDIKKLPRVRLRKAEGHLETADVLSIFSTRSRKAEAKVFNRLTENLKEIDEPHSTVLMVQVKNECGVLGDSHDGNGASLYSIPEQRRNDYGVRRIWIAYGTYGAVGVAPFGLETIKPEDSPFPKHYGLLKAASLIVLEAQRHPNRSVISCFDELPADGSGKHPSPVIRRVWRGFEMTIGRYFVFGKPGTGAGMVIRCGDGKLLLIGWGFQVRAKALGQNQSFTGILKFEEKIIEYEATGRLKMIRVFIDWG
ncbi:hypothetical protein CORC01_04623 [Colletotrichum orchidophilum]|uniref:DUF5597 domain-containing protein n=1 Tax=Colletotrichum orchidophilum TaxID=1209926 RepID=A0A1G4BF45_9PEZI|nr:uncharacterized protein CORC01_04623 [Colletotrichum orchidophilum]OHE99976.1 hypothetical protein CORC01_04623 [Colletotrichum orchidophilum]